MHDGTQLVCVYIHIIIKYVVLNSRDWSEIVWLPEILRLKLLCVLLNFMLPYRTACPYDLGVVVSFGYLLPSRLIRWFPR